MLKLSDAIALGRMYIPEPAIRITRKCAIGMALLAHNPKWVFDPNNDKDYDELHKLYPWLAKIKMQCPWCPEEKIRMTLNGPSTVFHPFDCHVMPVYKGYQKITLDQLIDWIRSIEPAADAAPKPSTQPAQTEVEELVTVT